MEVFYQLATISGIYDETLQRINEQLFCCRRGWIQGIAIELSWLPCMHKAE